MHSHDLLSKIIVLAQELHHIPQPTTFPQLHPSQQTFTTLGQDS
jgi:hypothetical protein